MWFLRRRKQDILALSAAITCVVLAIFLIAVLPNYGIELLHGGPAPVTQQDGQPINSPSPNTAELVPEAQSTDSARFARRPPYTKPRSPSLEVELQIPREELAKLPGSDPLVLAPHTSAIVGTTSDSETLARMFFEAINQDRRERGFSELRWDEDLAARAEGYAATRLWYWAMDEQGKVWKSRDEQIRTYYGVARSHSSIGVSSGLASTSVLEVAPQEAPVSRIVSGAHYGAALDPTATVIGISIVMLQNSTANVPIGWLAIFYQ